ncbi:FKBP-type peptidyl-prolyl cis-trans isomerase, partial [Salmonella enterica]|nr:FKBP-type peptidyl-prolyl cis-trans isomerase [Salmonella enterica]EDU7701048.1 FKBP-type peptidyl-prolyl cis-trans isomerase [Salmonella enterica]
GALSDGYLFDDSGLKGRVQRLKPEDILPALTDVLTTQRAGCHVEVLLSPSQAFGDEGVPGMIPGGATLKFDIQVQKKQPVNATAVRR